MAAIASKEEYLKKYLSGDNDKKRKKKKKPASVSAANRIKIVDDDFDFKTLLPKNIGNTLDEDVNADEPTIADVIDERPKELQILEKYRKDKRWKLLAEDNRNEDDSDNTDTGKEPAKNRSYHKDSNWGKAKKRYDSDSDPPVSRQRKRHDSSDSDASLPFRRTRHDSDSNPPVQRSRNRHDSDSDPPVPRSRNRHDSDSDPPVQSSRNRHDSDSDLPVRRSRNRHDSGSDEEYSKQSKRQSRKRQNSDVDQSVQRLRNRHDSDSDPPIKRSKGRNDSDTDQLVERNSTRNDKHQKNRSLKRKKSRFDSDSPIRKQSQKDRKPKYDSDNSPVRKPGRYESDSDQSPEHSRSKQEPRDKRKMTRTLGGAKAGLSTGREVREETERTKKKEDAIFNKIGDEHLGRYAKTVFRDKSGKKRDTEEEQREEAEKAKKKAEKDEQYMKWGKGMAQVSQQESNVEDALYEMSKPLTRTKDDQDLDEMLKKQDRAGDPMARFLKKKKTPKGDKKALPKYNGPQPPPNRFNIWPGYRWDGVDRSNGFEKKLVSSKVNKKAMEEIAYKWSTEDM